MSSRAIPPLSSRQRRQYDNGNRQEEGMIIIFLDIDGVLRPLGYNDDGTRVFPSCTLEALAHVLTQVPKAQLVLSSTWRVQESFIATILADFHAHEGGGVLHDVTFLDITDPTLHSERQYEIYQWLANKHSQSGTMKIKAWIAIDDEELLEGKNNDKYREVFQGHVVKTDSHAGMTLQDAALAVTLLQNQLQG